MFCSLGSLTLVKAAGLEPQLNVGGCPVALEYVITIRATDVKETSAALLVLLDPQEEVPVSVFPAKVAFAQFLVIVGVAAVVRSAS